MEGGGGWSGQFYQLTELENHADLCENVPHFGGFS